MHERLKSLRCASVSTRARGARRREEPLVELEERLAELWLRL